MNQQRIEPVEVSVRVMMAPEEAFRAFVHDLRRWWPLLYTFSQSRFATAAIEPIKGGHWYEVDDTGQKFLWGEVLAYESPKRLVLTFAISPEWQPEPAGRASQVEIRFVPEHDVTSFEEPATRIEVTHGNFEKHAEGGNALRARLASSRGWSMILTSFARRFTD